MPDESVLSRSEAQSDKNSRREAFFRTFGRVSERPANAGSKNGNARSIDLVLSPAENLAREDCENPSFTTAIFVRSKAHRVQ